jgi:hypothetical protein
MLTFSSAVQAQWIKYQDPDNRFELLLPEQSEVVGATVESILGTLTFEARKRQGNQGLAFHFQTAELVASPADLELSVQNRAAEIANALGGRLVSLNPIGTVSGVAVQFLVASGDLRIKGRIFLQNEVLAELWVRTDLKLLSHPDGNKFLESFRWKRLSDIELDRKLEEAGLDFQIDEDGDYQIAFGFEEENRRQVAYLSPFQSPYDGLMYVEIWSPFMVRDGELEASMANELLLLNGTSTTGNFQTVAYNEQSLMALFAHIVPLSTQTDLLYDFIVEVLIVADNAEAQFSKEDSF